MRLLSPFLSLLLIPLLAVMPMQAELAHAGSAAAGVTTPGPSNILKIRLADDSKATVEADTIVNGYAITVTDASGLPVADAAVAIRFPEADASGFFVNGQHSAVAYTDQSGVAHFPQVNWGEALGVVSIRITAVKGDLHAGALIEQTVVARTQPAPAITPMATPDAPSKPGAAVTSFAPEVEAAVDPASVKPATAAPSATAAEVKQPGTPASVAAVHSGATAGEPASARTDTAPTETAAATTPAVSVVTTGGSQSNNHSNRKWIILAAVIAGAGAGAALALSGKGGGVPAGAAAATTSIGTPTISLGH